jgi:hypothetical protein
MTDSRAMTHLEYIRAQADPEVRRFVDWAALELAEKLTKDFMSLGLPPMQAQKEAMAAVGILCRRVLGAAKAYHQYHR